MYEQEYNIIIEGILLFTRGGVSDRIRNLRFYALFNKTVD